MTQAVRPSPVFGDPRLPARFWAKLRIGSVPTHRPDLGPCWEWTACCTPKGYGQFGIGSRTDGTKRIVVAHRYAYEELIGPIADGLESDHLCRNHGCVRLSHLEPVTRAMNAQRGILARGEAHGSAKLREGQVREIRRLRGAVSQRSLAARFGVHRAQINRIQHGENWSHLASSALRSSAANVAAHVLPVGCGSLIQAEGRAGRQSSETQEGGCLSAVLAPSSVDSGDGAEVNTMRVGKDTPVQGLGAPGPAVNVTAFQASVQKGDLPPHGHRRTPASSTP